MKTSHSWFDVDPAGLGKLVAQRPKVFLIYELVANCLDEATSRIDITLEKVSGKPLARLVVRDDNPSGFADLRHAFTLFAESRKKTDPELRGRYNFGEKLCISQTEHATVRTTTGVVEFASDGKRHEHRRGRTEVGSEFSATVRMTHAEFEACLRDARAVLVPERVELYLNGERIDSRAPLRTFAAVLPTVVADAEGALRPTRRKTTVEVYATSPGEEPLIYEMGIPVASSDHRYHLNVLQKVPLTLDREHVTDGFLLALRTHTANALADILDAEAARDLWVDEALSDPRIEPEAVRRIIDLRFGEKAVSYDPSDPEANYRAVGQHYTVVHGGMLSREQWANVKAAEALTPAGRVFPTPKPFSNDPSAPAVQVVPEEKWTPAMHRMVERARRLSRLALDRELPVLIVNTTNNFAAACGSGTLYFNLFRLGHRFFEQYPTNRASVTKLLIHELAHEKGGHHLADEYHDEQSRIGGLFLDEGLKDPSLFD